jgi:hypothetical protein
MQTYLDIVPHNLLLEQARLWEEWLTLNELIATLMEMDNDKQLGINNFLFEFHKATWNSTGLNMS